MPTSPTVKADLEAARLHYSVCPSVRFRDVAYRFFVKNFWALEKGLLRAFYFV